MKKIKKYNKSSHQKTKTIFKIIVLLRGRVAILPYSRMVSLMGLFWIKEFAASTTEWEKSNSINPLIYDIIVLCFACFLCFLLAQGRIFG